MAIVPTALGDGPPWGSTTDVETWAVGTPPYLDVADEDASYLNAYESSADYSLDFENVPAGPLVLEVQAYPHSNSWFHVGLDGEWGVLPAQQSEILCHYSTIIPNLTWGMATFDLGKVHAGGPLRLWFNPDSVGNTAKISYIAIQGQPAITGEPLVVRRRFS